ncbi:hypothetical protein DEALK_10980 [Dehalogenimonas alkenigignens]|uniref:Uncharacterized protein n=1 Tax=Dehalogenimonas alkenigignens TaxID=1217799 RepID=A0A0W0GI53_9CHLR|nr:hypothetical protein DEALK_10980 [Dehalogenimonas alkenigignens]
MSIIVPCKVCNGSGMVRVPDPNMPRITGATVKVPCSNCGGSGKVRI